LWTNSGSVRRAHYELKRSAELYRVLEDLPQLGATLSRLAFTAMVLERRDDAERSIAEALKLLGEAGKTRALASAYATQVCVEARLGRYASAQAVGEKAIELCEAVGAERLRLVVAGNLTEFALEQGDVDGAVEAGRALIAAMSDSAHSDTQAFVLGLMVAALTFRGDLAEALVTARRAAPLLREQGMLFELFDHLALRAALAGRLTDAAKIIGYSDAAHQTANRPREPIGKRASDNLSSLLQDGLPGDQIAMLKDEGARLTEDRVTALALSE
jgi:tetratricopeptide (TPR) repeat protein